MLQCWRGVSNVLSSQGLFSDDIKETVYLRDKFTGTSNIECAKYWHNKVTDHVHKAKRRYYWEVISASLSDGKKWWKLIRHLAPKSSNISPTTLNTGDQVISDLQEIVGSFNEFFTHIADFITDNITSNEQPSNEKLIDFIQSRLSIHTEFEIPDITEDFVLKQLLNLKAICMDGIAPKLLCLGVSGLAAHLNRILNLSISSVLTPDEWKTS